MFLDIEDNLSVVLEFVYAILNLLGAIASRKAYILKSDNTDMRSLYLIHLLLAVSMVVLAIVAENPFLVFGVYVFIYLLFNVRKPIFVDEVDEHIETSERATILSVSSQFKSLLLMIFAPILGWIADQFGISVIMFMLAVFFVVSLRLLKIKE